MSTRFFLVFSILSQSCANGLLPIEIPLPQNDDSISSKTFKNSMENLEGKVIQNKQQLSETNRLEYDSLDDIHYIDEGDIADNPIIRGKKNIKQWDHWGKWSDCSVSCGVGKTVRWRHCVSEGCAKGEKEAQIRTCTMKPCP